MSFLMYELAKNPDIQEKAYQEINEVLKKHDGKLTYDSVGDMKYVNYCLLEILRLWPAIPRKFVTFFCKICLVFLSLQFSLYIPNIFLIPESV